MFSWHGEEEAFLSRQHSCVYQMSSQEICICPIFPSHLQTTGSCLAAMGNTQGLSELFNMLIAIAGSCKELISMKVINIFKVSRHSNHLLLNSSKLLKSSPDHCNMYMPFFCRRIPCFWETKETSLVLCILCSINLTIQKLTIFEDWRTELATALRYPFSSIF